MSIGASSRAASPCGRRSKRKMQKPGNPTTEIVGFSSFSIPLIAAYALGNCTSFHGVIALDLISHMGSVEIVPAP